MTTGWKTVPTTATHNMLNAASARRRKRGGSSSGEIYRTMIDAAPDAPAVIDWEGTRGAVLLADEPVAPAPTVEALPAAIRYDILQDYANAHRADYNELCSMVRRAVSK